MVSNAGNFIPRYCQPFLKKSFASSSFDLKMLSLQVRKMAPFGWCSGDPLTNEIPTASTLHKVLSASFAYSLMRNDQGF